VAVYHRRWRSSRARSSLLRAVRVDPACPSSWLKARNSQPSEARPIGGCQVWLSSTPKRGLAVERASGTPVHADWLFSAGLSVANMLRPALDGGLLFFVVIVWIRGRGSRRNERQPSIWRGSCYSFTMMLVVS